MKLLKGLGGRKKVLVVGTFRSGTNLLKHLLETHFAVEVVFSEWFWKHGVPPTTIQRPVPEDVPIAVATKHPIPLNASLYAFWKKRRPELDIGQNLSEFLTRPFVVYDNTGGNTRPKYLYASPTDYWNQYHFSWLHWQEVEARRSFVQLERLHAEPESTITEFAERVGLKRQSDTPIVLPQKPVHPSQDKDTARFSEAETEKRESLTDADKVVIRGLINRDVARGLGYDDVS